MTRRRTPTSRSCRSSVPSRSSAPTWTKKVALTKPTLARRRSGEPHVRESRATDRASCPRNPQRDEGVRESEDGEARDPDLVGGLSLQKAAARRRPCTGRGLLVRRRVPHSQQDTDLVGVLEKEACRFAQENGISLVTVCPVVTGGAAPAPNACTSVPKCLSLLSGEIQSSKELVSFPRVSHTTPQFCVVSGDEAEFGVLRGMEMASGTVSLVHVDDVCRAELFVAEDEADSGGSSGELLEKPRVWLSSAKLIGEGFEFKYKTLDEIISFRNSRIVGASAQQVVH
ncbi:uncharacterized protein LOC133888142 isoform X1 [Phragmites australis]|uniref:uncharacterized protein LOC133888141 isoform X2 n=1 Tax=Phragmites australis TaxID=29695 RepID=UPI002D79B2B5|nr:uncharacterized protein LOC133888141 isoform X2 [Phragmites australis]XP_062184268.1 uncharacterized protein LOC133888142 isoform X1 [Phragmites australis]